MDLLQLARTIAPAYDATGKVDAVMVAGSVARGRADAFSDLELDIYWSGPPTPDDRRDVIDAVGGQLITCWDYEADEGEWSEEFSVAQHQVGISGFETGWIDGLITDVIERSNPEPLWQMRLAAINDGIVLVDHGVAAVWQGRLSEYPDLLSVSVVEHYLDPARLGSWHQRYALLARDDQPRLRALTTQIPVIILGALCGLNRVYVEHQDFKWAAATIARLTIAPVDLHSRLWQIAGQDLPFAVVELDALLLETLNLVDQQLPSPVTEPMRHALAVSRTT